MPLGPVKASLPTHGTSPEERSLGGAFLGASFRCVVLSQTERDPQPGSSDPAQLPAPCFLTSLHKGAGRFPWAGLLFLESRLAEGQAGPVTPSSNNGGHREGVRNGPAYRIRQNAKIRNQNRKGIPR
jgi:hypothetical protein